MDTVYIHMQCDNTCPFTLKRTMVRTMDQIQFYLYIIGFKVDAVDEWPLIAFCSSGGVFLASLSLPLSS